MKKLYWVKRYVQLCGEAYVYAENDSDAIREAEGYDIDTDDYVDEDWDSHEVSEEDLKYITEDDILNPEDKDE